MTLRKFTTTSVLVAMLFPQALHAADPVLVAIGSISGSYEDFATQTAAPLESGFPGNRLGGLGSGLAYAGGDIFIALPDRGPNAFVYNTLVDNTTSYIPRFQTLHLTLAPNPGAGLPLILTPMVIGTTLLSSWQALVYGTGAGLGLGSGVPALNAADDTFYFSGRSDNFNPAKVSTNPRHARLDPEGIRVSRDGTSVFVTDEYGPYVYEFDRESGKRVSVYSLPDKFASPNLSPIGDTEIAGNVKGRVANKGMEGLAITPNGRTLVGAMQSPLIQDGGTGATGLTTRIVTIDVKTGATREYAYPLDSSKTTVSEILAINDHEFLVDERDSKGLGDNSTAVIKKIYKIDLLGAQDVSHVAGASNLASKAVTKVLFLDVVAALVASGIPAFDIPAKLEGIAFGQDVVLGGQVKHTLFIANDNDYSPVVPNSQHATGTATNPNAFYVFAFDDNDLPGYTPQRFSRGHHHDGWDDDDRDDRTR